ncbi:hypothetical protein HANVADRAFT_51444 [Hanseniaspora valbyensis NRRL Y-1626]|uniref:Nop52-domain-containing protein n=1 Tax=Hanseniaspora valbyensis NRRL Y-1626 TaxID=766949 RepID=A0A1B7TIH7_9ASCO|nr:hypothetical protein HANVADRAFT_51444 [Hanseniaspora valbyensis NRRL Y-1626]
MDPQNNKFINNLASNHLATRRKSINTITQRLKNLKKQSESDRIWKGLYYAMWFSDRPLTQQKLCDELAEVYTNEELWDGNFDKFIKFSKSFWKIIALEWLNIDYHRINKYLLLIRRVFNKQLEYVIKQSNSDENDNGEKMQEFVDRVLGRFVFSGDKRIYNGIPMHVIDISTDELVKIYTKLNKDSSEKEENDDEEEEEFEITEEIVNKSHIDILFSKIFELTNDYNNNKVLRIYIKDNLVTDDTLIDWGIVEKCYKPKYVSKKDTEEDKEENEDDEEEEEETWKGF